jgi:hypothetical protein
MKMKRWSAIIAAVMALVLLVLSPMSALADDGQESGVRPGITLQGALAIVAPRVAMVNQETRMTVFLRADQEPFEGAGVWAITREQAEVYKEQASALRQDETIKAEEKDYEALADIHGTFLGRTGPNGKVYPTFTEAGNYLLIALRNGYYPGATWIVARDAPRVLTIEAPGRAGVGEDVTMTVRNRVTSEPVTNAGIWAITRDQVDTVREQFSALSQDKATAAEEKDYETLIGLHGILLGQTDLNGNLTYAFQEEGIYVLVAVKQSYFPGFAAIGIRNAVGVLAIVAPPAAPVGTEVNIAALNRLTLEPVGEVGIWAIHRDQVEAFNEQVSALRQNTDVTVSAEDYGALAEFHGTLLGWTDGNGRLSHTFDRADFYLLVAVKQAYFPGCAPINISDASQVNPTDVESATTDNGDVIQ